MKLLLCNIVLQLYVDDLLVYNGTLESCHHVARGILPTVEMDQPYHTILFTNDKQMFNKERHTILTWAISDNPYITHFISFKIHIKFTFPIFFLGIM